MECADLRGNLESLVNALLQFADCLSGIGNNDDLFRMDALFLHQIFDLSRHSGSLTGTGTCNQQAMVIIRNNRTALFFIQFDYGINILKNMIKVILFLFQYPIYIVGVMRNNITVQGMHLGKEGF